MAKKRRTMKRIGDVARAGGVGVETVRFYEREGLIEQPPKPERGWREYGDKQLAQLGNVRLAQDMGLTLRDMRRLQRFACGPQQPFCAAVRETLSERLARIDADIAVLKRKRLALSRWLSQCKARGKTDACPLYTQLQPLKTQPKGRRK